MKKIIFVLGVLVVIVGGFAYVWLGGGLSSDEPVPPLPEPGPIFPAGEQNPLSSTTPLTQPLVLKETAGASLTIPDFRRRDGVTPDRSNPGFYYLAGVQDPYLPQPPYSILYSDFDTSFTITLWQRPLAENRDAAVVELMQKTGLSKEEVCRVPVSVIVPDSASEVYAGQSVGISFCGGVTLTE